MERKHECEQGARGSALAVLSHRWRRFEASHDAPLTKHYRHMRRDDKIDTRKVGDVGGGVDDRPT